MTDASGLPASVFIDQATGLPLELETNPAGAQGTIRVTLDDWSEIDGIRYFHSFVLSEGAERAFTYRYQRIAPNTVSAIRFTAPAQPAVQDERDALIEILRDNQRAHLTTDAGLLCSRIAETLVEVHAGGVDRRSRAEVEASFRACFGDVDFELWDDLQPPVIRLSEDATMAWVVRTVRVRSVDREVGEASEFTSAFTATYERLDGEWKMTSVTLTFLL